MPISGDGDENMKIIRDRPIPESKAIVKNGDHPWNVRSFMKVRLPKCQYFIRYIERLKNCEKLKIVLF